MTGQGPVDNHYAAAGRNSGNMNHNDPAQFADPLGFASRLFQQIGSSDFLMDEESKSESESVSDSGDDSQPSDIERRQQQQQQQQQQHQRPVAMAIAPDHTSVSHAGKQPREPLCEDAQERQTKRSKLEAMAQLISPGPIRSLRMSSSDSNSPLSHPSPPPPPPPPEAIAAVAAVALSAGFNRQDPIRVSQALSLSQDVLNQFNFRPVNTSGATAVNTLPVNHVASLPLLSQTLPQLSAGSDAGSGSRRGPLEDVGAAASHRSGTPIAAAAHAPQLGQSKGPGVIDLTEEGPTVISDDDVVIDESKTTTVANRNMCFGMIQSLIVTLYPRHLEYEEGKADRVLIKRATTNQRASLAVEHEGGLYGYIVSELAETLVPLVDANMVWWEAFVPRQRKQNNVSAPVNIILYGRPDYQMAIAKALHGKVRLEDPVSFDHRTRYSNPLVPAPGEKLSPYDLWRGVTTPSHTNGSALHSYSSYYGYSGYGSSARSAEEIKNQIDGVFKDLRSATDLPEVDPPSLLTTGLYRHQKQALYFLLEREKQEDYEDKVKNKLTSLWRKRHALHRHPTFLNVITSQETTAKPASMLGGILADDMGLGKTITVISIIMATLNRGMHSQPRIQNGSQLHIAQPSAAPDFLNTGEQVTEYDSPPSPTIRPLMPTAPRKPSAKRKLTNIRVKSHATLIVCPLSTVQNWEEQFDAHVQKNSLHVYVYHGGQRVSDPTFLAKHDVVITTYNLLGTEYSKECKGRESEGGMSKHPSVLQHVDWFRVVLDEAHIIKESTTVQSKAACALNAERRWCLTGTPIQNKLDDLYALVKFLQLQPFHEKAHWTHYISKPIKAANPIGVTRLQTLMKAITLRRTKNQMVNGKPLLDLPERTDHMRVIDLSLNERQMYQRMENRAKQTVDKIVQENKIMKNYAHILQAVLKLRQICAHYALVKDMNDDLDMSTEFNLSKASAVLSLLQDSGNDQCNYCFSSSITTPIVTRCEHLLCPECVKKLNPISFMLIQRANANVSVAPELKTDFTCPQCAFLLRPVDLIQIQEESEDRVAAAVEGGGHIHTRTDENGMFIHSTKVKALMDDLVRANEIAKATGEPMVKSVVFSQWTSMLDLIEDGLREIRVNFTRLDGTMQRSDRTSAMMNFKDRPEIGVILISLKAGGVGLNLTAAQRVYLMDPHWNPSVESQAIDRIHRLGQTKPVDVIRFIIKESIEENILELQKRKTELSEMTFSEKLSKQEVLKRRLEDLKYLFNGSSDLMKKNRTTTLTLGTATMAISQSPTPSSSSATPTPLPMTKSTS